LLTFCFFAKKNEKKFFPFLPYSTALPDVLEVAKNGEPVPLDDYMHLHSVASKLEERSKTTNLTQLEQELQNKTRALKVSIGLIVLAVLLPNLFSLVLTALVFAATLFCAVCYYYVSSFVRYVVSLDYGRLELLFFIIYFFSKSLPSISMWMPSSKALARSLPVSPTPTLTWPAPNSKPISPPKPQ
jgi:hypothetical protein